MSRRASSARDPRSYLRAATLLLGVACLVTTGCRGKTNATRDTAARIAARDGEAPPSNRRVVLERDLNGDGVLDRVSRDLDTCGSSGCEYVAEVSGDGGARTVLTARAKDFWPAESSTDGVTDLEFAEFDHDSMARYVLRYRWADGRYVGPLDHLPRGGQFPPPVASCRRAVVETTAPILLLPAREVEVSRWDDAGWHRGPPRTPVVRALAAGVEVTLYNEVVDRARTRWVSVESAPETGHVGWIDASALRCVERAPSVDGSRP